MRDWTMKASLGRAVRNPTASELFQGSIVDNAIVNSDPLLRAEKSWTGEFSAERVRDDACCAHRVRRAHARRAVFAAAHCTVNTVQNIGRIRTNGLELAYQADHVVVRGLSLSSSVTYADSIITENRRAAGQRGQAAAAGAGVAGNLLATYHTGQHWTTSFGARYSGRQYSALDNSDVHADTYMGVSDYLVTDVRVRYRVNRNWSASVGIDNLWQCEVLGVSSVSAEDLHCGSAVGSLAGTGSCCCCS
jgi:iron complex outermembrane receptor protein